MDNTTLESIKTFLQERIREPISEIDYRYVRGGSINDTFKISVNSTFHFFCKTNSAVEFPGLFRAEISGLQRLERVNSIRVPKISGLIEGKAKQILLMEWIDQGPKTPGFWKQFGEQLAAVHNQNSSTYGLDEDNYMGSLQQLNSPKTDWVEFFIMNRLQPQLELAINSGRLTSKELAAFERLYKQLPDIFPVTKPSVVHGDLWSGNFLCDAHAQPVLIDPACYYGIPAVDLAMTTLFGEADALFYQSYHYHRPLPKNHLQQWEVCNLYPLLIHLNLFGPSYFRPIADLIKKF